MKNSVKIIVIIVIIGAFLFPLVYPIFNSSRQENSSDLISSPQPKIETYDPPFTKEGELEITDTITGKVIKKISIEIADNEKEITQGLMYRSSMVDTTGMLFIFNYTTSHDFWMENTKIPLDIVFIDPAKKVVTIQRNTTPYSEKPIPSEKPVLYVLEVNAGFCDKYGVKVGNLIEFERTDVFSSK